jgi:hypothetical protein
VFKHFYQKIYGPKRVLFYRDLQQYSGGHQKVADYFEHLASSNTFAPYISFSQASRWDEFNPWLGKDVVEYRPTDYDYVFLAGLDWRTYLAAERPQSQPVINLIQHVRHAELAEDVYEYLGQRAIRICVSQQVADAIQGTGRVNGPVFTIPNGVALPELDAGKAYDLVVLGIKQPGLALSVYDQLRASGLKILLVDQQVPRRQWFECLAASRIALLLPNHTEGFYLPALEAMNYCDIVIVPDCIGNRDFCKDSQNCLMPEYNIESILASVNQATYLLQNEHVLTEFKREMGDTLRVHSLANERKAFLELMGDVKSLWSM